MSRPIVAIVALVVLLSTLAGVAGGAPASGSGVESGALSAASAAQQTTAADGDLRSGGTYWSGQQLAFDASGILPADTSESDRTFEVWRVADDGRLNQRIATFSVDGNGSHTLETDDLAGRYVLRYGDQPVYVHDGVGYLDSPPDGSGVSVQSSEFEIARQTLSLDWSDPTVYPGQLVTLTLSSNRDDYAVAVSGTNVSFQNLTAAFPEAALPENYDARADEDVLLVQAGASTSYGVDTASLDPGEGGLAFDVVDATAAETADLEVLEPAEDGRFVSLERRDDVGDVVDANVSCTHCFLVVGGPGQGLLDVVELTDSNGDGHVVLQVNTRYAGMQTSLSGYPSGVNAYTSPADSVSRYSPAATLETVEEELNYNVVTLDDLRKQQGFSSKGREKPIGSGSIELRLASSDFLIDRSAYGSGEPLGSQLVVRDESDVRTVTLEPRALAGAESMAAPGGAQLPGAVGELREAAGPRDSVALGDHLVFRFDVSGVFGYLHTVGTAAETVENNDGEGIRLRLEDVTDDGTGSTNLPLRQTAAEVYGDPATDSLYVAIKTGRTGRTNLQEGRYRATLTLTGVDGRSLDYSTRDAYDGYPYLAPGETEEASATATIEPASAAIVSPEDGSSPHLDQNGSLVVRGTASLAPGGTLDVEATATEFSWDTSTTATVNETGHWTGSLNLTEAPGETFTVTVHRGDQQFDEGTYSVLPPVENESGEGGSGGSSGGGSGGQSGGVIPGGGLLSGLGGLAGLVVPVGGGLGLLVVVWAVWKLVIRRMLLGAED